MEYSYKNILLQDFSHFNVNTPLRKSHHNLITVIRTNRTISRQVWHYHNVNCEDLRDFFGNLKKTSLVYKKLSTFSGREKQSIQTVEACQIFRFYSVRFFVGYIQLPCTHTRSRIKSNSSILTRHS